MKLSILPLLLLLALSCSQKPQNFTDLNGDGTMQPYENQDLSTDKRVNDILTRLTVDDKINLVVGIGFNFPGRFETSQPIRVAGAVGGTYTFDSLGIRGLLTTDGPAGVRIMPIEGTETYYCTAFPIATLISSTWDTDLAYQMGVAMGNEVKEYGMDILLAPALNIHRDPRAGRNYEYYSEDPLLSGKITASLVNGVQSLGVGTSVKHFVANNQETNRNLLNTVVSERALREIYLKGFEIAIKESSPWTVMSAYNMVNGTPTSEDYDLLTGILRNEWGYEGFVMTDWFAGTDAVSQLKAGNDLLMPGTSEQRKALKDGFNDGTLTESDLDLNAGRILKILLNSPSFNGYAYSNKPNLDANAQLSRKVAVEGTVLLKNDEVLPVESNELKVGAFGIGSYDFITGGTGSGDVVEAYSISLVQGLRNAGITIDEKLEVAYEAYLKDEKAKSPPRANIFMPLPVIPERPLTNEEVESIANNSDLALITLSRSSGEFEDRKLEGDFYLTVTEQDMIEKISKSYHAQGKKVVMILNIGNVIEMQSWRDKVDAIVLPWQGGQEAGNAVVDVLTGKVNPSGKLPTSFPIKYEHVPSSKNFPGEELGDPINIRGIFTAAPAQVIYEEGIYVGYRYYSTFDQQVAYPFGYGLSYTSFEFDAATISNNAGKIEIKVNVRNSGNRAGKEVVQVYITSPDTVLDQPALELRAFGKTPLLDPQQEMEMTFTIAPKDYASWNTDRASWVVSAGEYEVKIGSSSEDIRTTANFVIADEIVVETLSNAVKPKMAINDLSSSSISR
ncbi:beta-glucosidase [Marinoscillum sp. MHG1-6]|uniref:beta-glucosidase family protein n=1 Tax=Marinoscillum sp. MHG1-6 TaxID=2959627 RepID=UPI0021584F37|nr:glycoside hydrolase family 3 N-terminal domain-containing protein [Marinoscillum sp. MHG1-6]